MALRALEPAATCDLPSATELARSIAEGRESARDVVEAHLARIAERNGEINAIVTIDTERARAEADRADERQRRGEPLGPVHGLPITIKDTLSTAGMRTTSGSVRLSQHVPQVDAAAVRRLRDAGAIVLGKTNTPEFATGPESDNELFSWTRNPVDTRRTAGGSSGGPAASVAAGFAALDIGSDIGGSIRVPAHFCGVVGLKPTEALVSPVGHIPPPPGRGWGLLRTLLSVGPLARTVEDAGLALRIIGGPDPRHPETPPVDVRRRPVPRIHELEIAWSSDLGVPVDADTRAVLARLASDLAAAGATVERTAPPDFDLVEAAALAAELQMTATAAPRRARYLPAIGFRAASHLIREPIGASFVRGMGGDLASLSGALVRRDRMIADLEDFLSGYDAWVIPVAAIPAYRHRPLRSNLRLLRETFEVDGRRVPLTMAIGALTSAFNLTGGPVLVLPAGRSAEGLPIGVQLVGRRWRDADLLAVGEAIARVIGSTGFGLGYVPEPTRRRICRTPGRCP